MPGPVADRRAIGLFFVLLFAQPFPIGGNRPAVWWLFEVGFLGLAAWIWWRRPARIASLRASRDPVRWLWPALLAWLLLQLLAGLSGPGAQTDPNGLIQESLKGLSWVAVAWIALLLLRSRRGFVHFAALMVALGGAEAVLGLATYNNQSLGIWGGEAQLFHAAKGSYPNYNHFAGLLELCLPFSLVMLLRLAREGRLLLSFAGLATLGATLAMGIAMLMSGSRSGVAAFFLAGVLLLPLWPREPRGRQAQAGRRWVPAAVGLGLVVLLVGLLSSDLLYRFATRGVHSIRPILWGDLFAAVQAHPWLGNGAGTFDDLSPLYKSWLLPMRDYHYAHNDYLHWLIESGVPLALALFALIGSALLRLLGYLRNPDHLPERRGWVLACLWGLLALALHGLFDFNFHIPANAALYMAVLGVGLSITHGWRRSRRRRHSPADG